MHLFGCVWWCACATSRLALNSHLRLQLGGLTPWDENGHSAICFCSKSDILRWTTPFTATNNFKHEISKLYFILAGIQSTISLFILKWKFECTKIAKKICCATIHVGNFFLEAIKWYCHAKYKIGKGGRRGRARDITVMI